MTDSNDSNYSPGIRIKCVSQNGSVRGVAIQATRLVREMAAIHKLSGDPAVGLGEAVIAGLLLGSYMKAGERVNLNLQGTGRYVQALVDATSEGTVRGYLITRSDPKTWFFGEDGSLGPWGDGFLSVLRTKHQEGSQPYIGTVPLVTGHLAKDLTFYWLQSEQVASSVGIVVNASPETGEIIAAGGFFIQALPDAKEKDLKAIESQIHDIQSLAQEFLNLADPRQLLSRIFQDSPFLLLEEKEVKMVCHCSLERVQKALVLVGVQELSQMLATDGRASVKCDFCEKDYVFDGAALQDMINKLTSN